MTSAAFSLLNKAVWPGYPDCVYLGWNFSCVPIIINASGRVCTHQSMVIELYLPVKKGVFV